MELFYTSIMILNYFPLQESPVVSSLIILTVSLYSVNFDCLSKLKSSLDES